MGNNLSGQVDANKGVLLAGTVASLALSGFFLYDIIDRRARRQAKALKRESESNAGGASLEHSSKPGESNRTKHAGSNTKHGNEAAPIYRIAITGGPCGGKTSALAFLNEKLSEKGFKVFCVPEVPTMTALGGGMIIMGLLTQDKIIKFQTLLMKTQMNLEDYFIDLAELNGTPSVVLFDRGVMDPAAYMSPEQLQALLDEQGWNKVKLRDQRYDMVIHMVTAADGAEEFYTLANNQARYESDLGVAIETDRKTQNAWIGQPHLVILDNTTEKGFDRKLNRALEAIGKCVGFPTPGKYFRKYLIETEAHKIIPSLPAEIHTEKFIVEEVFLKTGKDGLPSFIRKRGQNGSYTYSMTKRTINEKGERVESKRQLSAQEYLMLYNQRSENYMILHKERQTFLWEKQNYILDTFLNTPNKFTLLRIETDKSEQILKLPSFLKVISEVTNDKSYSSEVVARINAEGSPLKK